MTAFRLGFYNIYSCIGFDNPHYFSRLFTKVSGVTPSQFKARISIPNDKFTNGVPNKEWTN